MFVVVFEVHPHAAQVQQYLDFAKLLRPELEQIDGFIDNERFASTQNTGRVLSLSTWRDEKALIRWRTHAQHHHVQEQGRTQVFADYRLRIGEVVTDSTPPHGQSLLQQRFDATESSRAKMLTLIERKPVADDPNCAQTLAQAATIDTFHVPSGWIASEEFLSITQVGKRITLAGWSTADAARAWHAERSAALNHPAVRSRFVRVVRAYGMQDRSEAPQYYPAVSSHALIW